MSLLGASPTRQRVAGGVFLAILAGAVVVVLGLSGRSLGRGVSFEVELQAAGSIRPGGRVLLAGYEIGEVRGVRPLGPQDGRGGRERHVVLDCFVKAAWAPHVHENSDLFIATPSILGEAFLEVGLPRGGAEPGKPIATGQRLRGGDPPDLDHLLARIYGATVELMALLGEQRPEWEALLAALDSLLGNLAGLPVDKGQLARLYDQAARAIDDATGIAEALGDVRAYPRARALIDDLTRLAGEVRPELAAIADKADLASARVKNLDPVFAPARRDDVTAALQSLARAARRGERITGDVAEIGRRLDRGEGTAGALRQDRELFDDLRETHRLLKWKAWRLFIKPRANAPTAPE